jgi:hypothetical protein
MGRPIKSKFFVKGGAQNPSNVVQYQGVTVSRNATGAHYSKGATAVFSAPQDPAGVQATLSLTIALPGAGGGITAATIGNVGSGYNAAPAVTINKPSNVTLSCALSTTTSVISGITTTGIYVGMRMDSSPGMPASNYVTVVGATSVTGTYHFTSNTTTNVTFSDVGSGATFNVGLTHAETDTGTIACSAYVTGGSSAVNSAIIKQQSSRSYLVENTQGRGHCKLVAAAPGKGEMTIVAKDSDGNQYYVTKLTSRKARVVQKSGSNYQFADGSIARWTLGWANAVAGTSVGVQSY